MANPAWTDAIRNQIHQRIGIGLGLGRIGLALANWLHPQNTAWLALRINGDEGQTLITAIAFTAGRIGTDTDVNGVVWGRVVDGSPNTVNLYNDSARTVLVATGTAADGAAANLAPQTGYYLDGSITLGTIGANLDFALLLIPPLYSRIGALFNGDEVEDDQNATAGRTAAVASRALALQFAVVWQAFTAQIVRTTVRRRLASVSSTAILNPGVVRQSSGAVVERATGLLEDLRQAQDDNLSGSGEIKAGASSRSAASTFPSWAGTLTGPTLGDRVVPGLLTATCVKGLDAKPPTFDVTFDSDDNRDNPDLGQSAFLSPIRMTLGQTWRWPERGIDSMLIAYSPTSTNTTGTAFSTTGGDWSVTGLTSDLSDAGILYARYEATGTMLEFYKTSAGAAAQDQDDLVTEVVSPGASTVFTTSDLGNGLVVVGKTGTPLNDGDRATINFRAPTASQPASYFTVAISETVEASEWVKQIRDGGVGGVGYRPNTAATPNLLSGWIEAGMPFPNWGTEGDAD